MFRIVTDFVENPSLLLLCDERRCGCFATGNMPPQTQEAERAAAVKPFLEAAMQAGWALGIDAHLCPQHAARIANGRRLVQVPQFSFKQ